MIPYVEINTNAYDFSYPILANILDSVNFNPPGDGVYMKAGFGHRYLSNTATKSDNHGGYDYWQYHEYNGQTFDDSNKVVITCMCDGYISEVLNGPDSLLELTGTGRSVRVTCDSSFQSFGYKIKINYRHLSAVGSLAEIADTAAFGTVNISKGDTIGLIGESGTTTNIHLHLSTLTLHPTFGNAYVNTTRLFNPDESVGVLKKLENAKIELLHDWPDSALFRVIWPYNETINRFEFTNSLDTVVFDKEDAYNTGATLRDKHDCLPRVSVFPYQFNGSLTAQTRYLNEMNNMPSIFPASPNRDTNLVLFGYNHIPITHDSISYVYDLVIKDLDPTHSVGDFNVRVSDVWGYTIDGDFTNSGTDIITSCDDYTWINGTTYTASNNGATDTLLNSLGADSLVTLNLTILNSSSSTDAVNACGSYIWQDGNVYTSSNSTATYILTNAQGCDSTITLNLSIDSVDTSVIQIGFELTAQETGASYQWINCSDLSPIAGATDQSYTPNSNGEYAVIIDNGNCTDTSQCFSIETIGILENELGSNLKVYPNPSKGALSVDLGLNYSTISVKLIDLKGKVISNQTFLDSQMIHLNYNESASSYLLLIEANGKKATISLTLE